MARQAQVRAADVADVWQRFKESQDPKLREELILRYASLVKYVAGRIAVGLPRTVDFDDLLSYGIFGLIDAVENVRPPAGGEVRDLRHRPHPGRHPGRPPLHRLDSPIGPAEGPQA